MDVRWLFASYLTQRESVWTLARKDFLPQGVTLTPEFATGWRFRREAQLWVCHYAWGELRDVDSDGLRCW